MKYFILFFVSILILSCSKKSSDSTNKVDEKSYSSNIIILLDLSDRILLKKDQNLIDEESCMIIINNAIDSIKKRMYVDNNGIKQFDKFKSKFQVILSEQMSPILDKRYYENLLSFSINNETTKKSDSIIKNFSIVANKIIKELYVKASSYSKTSDYSGADIWKFFNEDLETLINRDTNTKNYLFILTDGYLYFENYNGRVNSKNRFSSMEFLSKLRDKDWESKFDKEDYGLIPLKKNYSNLKIAVMEITPRDFWNEYDLIKKVWGKWFEEMGIKKGNYMIMKTESSNRTQNTIIDFLK